jgi:hypothetical protein
MSLAALLSDLTAAGINLVVTERGTLHYRGYQTDVDRWLPEIRARKDELLALLRNRPPTLTPNQHADIQEAMEERAAILEFDAGLPRPEAEAQAVSAMQIYRYRITDKPNDWLVMIAPGCDLGEARRTLVMRFGAERLMDVQVHRPKTT